MRGFDSEFWIALIGLILLMFTAYLISHLTNLNFVLVLSCIGAFFWALLHVWGKKLKERFSDNHPVIYCEWDDRLNETDFDANQISTITDLEDIGLTLDKAAGKTFIFHTEPSYGSIRDLYFEGVILHDSKNKTIIRANKPLVCE